MTGATLPQQSTAVVATGYGGPEVVELVSLPLATPGAGEALVEVRAAGVNPIDWKRYSGMMGDDSAQLPMRLGFEASGTVLAVGEDGSGEAGPVRAGDEVIAYPISGAYATHVVVDTSKLLPKPANVSFEEAAGLLLSGTTAIHTLEAAAVGDGDTVLIHGGSGGVGLIAVQVALTRGAHVIATASERRHDALRALGATPVVYGDGLLERVRTAAPDGVDASIDTVGTEEALDVSRALVADRDRIVAIAMTDVTMSGGVRLLGGPGEAGEEVRDAARRELPRLCEEGVVHVPTTSRPLSEAADAHRDSIAGHSYGKVVLIP